MAKDAIDEALKGVDDAEKAFDGQLAEIRRGLDEKEKEVKARFEQMRRELDAKRKEQLSEEQKKKLAKKVDEEKEGIFSRFGDWMHNLAHNSMNAICKLLGMSPREDKWKEEQVQQTGIAPEALEEALSKATAPLLTKIEELNKKIELLNARGQEKDPEQEAKGQSQEQKPEAKNNEVPEPKKNPPKGRETAPKVNAGTEKKPEPRQAEPKTPEPTAKPETEPARDEEGQRNRNAPVNNLVSGEPLVPMADANKVPDEYKQLMNSNGMLTPNDFIAAFVHTAVKEGFRSADNIDQIIDFAGQALADTLKVNTTGVACECKGGKKQIAFSKDAFNLENTHYQQSVFERWYGMSSEKASDLARDFNRVIGHMNESLKNGMKLQPDDLRKDIELYAANEIQALTAKGMGQNKATDAVYAKYLQEIRNEGSSVMINRCRLAAEKRKTVAYGKNYSYQTTFAETGFIGKDGDRYSLAALYQSPKAEEFGLKQKPEGRWR